VAAYQPSAKTGVLAEMRPGSLVTVTVKKIEVLDRNLARVRFESIRRDPGMEAVRQDFRAIISFRFVGAPMRMEDRLINPLGFQVTTYRRDAEAGPIAEEAKTATAAPPEALEAADDGKAEPSPAGQKPDSGAASATPKTDMPGLAKRKDEKPVGPIKPADSQRAPQDVQP
jgi:type IV secretion system protein VirB8